MSKQTAGTVLVPRRLTTMHGAELALPDDELTHLQFLRFAGCPICNLHLRAFVNRNDELRAAGIREVVIFHSTREELLKYEAELPFDAIADPDKKLYREFGVERSLRALLDPRAWPSMVRGLITAVSAAIRGRAPFAPLAPKGGALGLPADLLIASDGFILAAKYGEHASDQWTVDEVLELAAANQPESGRSGRSPARPASARPAM
jgi:AhpC/TSA antioxidant enzyme